MSGNKLHLGILLLALLSILGLGQAAHRFLEHTGHNHTHVHEVQTPEVWEDDIPDMGCAHYAGASHDHSGCSHHHHTHDHASDSCSEEEDGCGDAPCDGPCDDHADCELCLMLASLVSPVPTETEIVSVESVRVETLSVDLSVALTHRRMAAAPTRGPPAG